MKLEFFVLFFLMYKKVWLLMELTSFTDCTLLSRSVSWNSQFFALIILDYLCKIFTFIFWLCKTTVRLSITHVCTTGPENLADNTVLTSFYFLQWLYTTIRIELHSFVVFLDLEERLTSCLTYLGLDILKILADLMILISWRHFYTDCT